MDFLIYKAPVIFLFYILILVISSFFSENYIWKYFHYIISVPAALILHFYKHINAIIAAIFVMLMLFLLFAYLFAIIPYKLFEFSLQDAAIIYLVLTCSSIVMTTFGDKLIKIWYNIVDFTDRKEMQIASIRIMGQHKIKYLIYTAYFLLLLFVNIFSLNGTILFSVPKLETALIQAFATYLAYDRLISNWKATFKKND